MDREKEVVAVYIHGIRGFEDKVMKQLHGFRLVGASQEEDGLLMVWLSDVTSLRSLKLLIGSKVIFKWRLHFFTDLNDYLGAHKPIVALSHHEKDMIATMTEWQRLKNL